MGWPEIRPDVKVRNSRSFLNIIEKLGKVLPLEEWKGIYEDKIQSDDVFIVSFEWKELMKKIISLKILGCS